MKRKFFTWAKKILLPREGEPIQPKKTTIIYLFLRKENNIVSYDLWIDGRHTQKTLTLKEIRRILSQRQYADFITQFDTIFEVPVNNLNKYVPKPAIGKEMVTNNHFTSGEYNRQIG